MQKSEDFSSTFVRMTGIEPAHREPLDPKSNLKNLSIQFYQFCHYLLYLYLRLKFKILQSSSIKKVVI